MSSFTQTESLTQTSTHSDVVFWLSHSLENVLVDKFYVIKMTTTILFSLVVATVLHRIIHRIIIV